MNDLPIHINKILIILNEKNFQVKLVQKCPKKKRVFCDKEKREIQIREKLHVRTKVFVFVQACLSLVHPKKDEKWIKAKTYGVWSTITIQEYERLKAALGRFV